MTFMSRILAPWPVLGLLVAMAGCAVTPEVPEEWTEMPGMEAFMDRTAPVYRVEFVKVTTPFHMMAHPDTVPDPGLPGPTEELLQVTHDEQRVTIKQHVDKPGELSWTVLSVDFATFEEAMAFRKLLLTGEGGQVEQVVLMEVGR